jgi:hypothetical protein
MSNCLFGSQHSAEKLKRTLFAALRLQSSPEIVEHTFSNRALKLNGANSGIP